ncbi:MAG: hypothetical protein WCJ35_01830 [Planctomycetota bacterium]
MNTTLTCLALALVGVDLGYRPASNGGTEFIIQINPATLQSLRPGEPIDIDVPREAREMRPSHFSITLGNERLPHEVPLTASLPPATAPIVPASPVMPAAATLPILSSATPSGREPVIIPPPSSAPSAPAVVPIATPANSAPAESRIVDLAPVNSAGSNSAQPDRPWLAMCLLVIALMASNGYVGWLFWETRQRYRGLLTRNWSHWVGSH